MQKPSPQKQQLSNTVLTEFKRLFLEARKEHSKAGERATASSPAHQVALAYSSAQKISGAEPLLDCLLAVRHATQREAALLKLSEVRPHFPAQLQGYALDIQGLLLFYSDRYDEAIECYQRALDTPGYDTLGDAHNNMGIAYAEKKEFDRAIECYQRALDTPGYDAPGDAYNNMGAAHSDKKEFDRAIECFQRALDAPGYDTPGNAHNNMGAAYADKKEFDRAIECFQRALDAPSYDTPGNAHFNMGAAHSDKKEFDRAIECFQRALDTPGFAAPGNAHNNMGATYADKKEFDRAIECYQRALDTPGYDTPGKAHNNMGVAYADKKEFDRAIECQQRALNTPGHDQPHMTRNNLALNLWTQGKLDQALAEIERVLKDPDTEGQQERARFIKSLIEESMAGFKPTEADEALAKADTLENSPVQDILDKLRQERDKYDTYLSREDVNTKEMTFSCLRGWSSAVTLLEGGSGRRWSGGGYFLRWKGKGIVIDPGFDFLDNFHDANFHMRDVDAIVVSHNHLDHNGDLNRLDDLRYQIHRVWKRKIAAKEEMKNDVSRCLFAMDEDTARSFPDDDLEYRGPPFKFSSADSKHKRWLERLNELPATVEFFPVQHGNDVPHAMGIRLRLHQEELPDFVFGYTGDTGYFDTLPKYLEGCDVLLAHISMPDTQEYTDPKHFKKVHLGYNGLTKLIQEAKPKMVLVGEFWAGLADIRIDLIKGLRSRTEGKIPILPTGLGFHLKLPTLEVECTSCRKPASYDQIKIAPATSPFGPLGYLCPRCLG